jgi:hypothetical protein
VASRQQGDAGASQCNPAGAGRRLPAEHVGSSHADDHARQDGQVSQAGERQPDGGEDPVDQVDQGDEGD